jgi:hypothetical protein
VMEITNSDAIVIDEICVDSESSDYDAVQSNIDFVNELLGHHYRVHELPQCAMQSYYVDYYLAEMLNGGFGQFVFNSRWKQQMLLFIRGGLAAMGAVAHLGLFEEGAGLVASLGEDRLENFFATSLQNYGKSTELAVLNAIDKRFFALDHRDSLRNLNCAWLKTHSSLATATIERINAELQRRAELVPDQAERLAEAEANAPRYLKLVRALVAKAGQKLQRLTAGDPNRVFEGQTTIAWYFLTDQGLFHMVDAGGKAIMFRGQSTTDRLCQIDAP